MLLGIIAFAVVALVIFSVSQRIDRDVDPSQACDDPSPTLSFPSVNAITKETNTPDEIWVKVNGGNPINASVQTDYTVGSTLDILYKDADFINTIVTGYKVECGDVNPGVAEMFATDDVTLQLKNSDGLVMFDAATGVSANNQSTIGSGGSKNLKLSVTGNNNQFSGDLSIIVELNSTVACKLPVMTGGEGVSDGKVPSTHATEGSSTQAQKTAFDISGQEGATESIYNLQLASNDGKECEGPIFITGLSKQAHNDKGEFVVGVIDSTGNDEFEDTFDYDGFIAQL